MALIFPSIENIERLKVSPESGEWFLLKHLIDTLDDSFEIYFQPFLNGFRPDIVIMKKRCCVVIIEVKNWDFSNWVISKDNNWYFRDKRNKRIEKLTPFQQVFNYKANLYNLQINGLLEKTSQNPNFYKLIRPFVYFHNQTKESINSL